MLPICLNSTQILPPFVSREEWDPLSVRPPFVADQADQGALGAHTEGGIKMCNYRHLDLSTIAWSPINLDNLQDELVYYDHPDKESILHGFTTGFPLHYTGPRVHVEYKNLKSARELPEVVQQKINKETNLGRVAGPF